MFKFSTHKKASTSPFPKIQVAEMDKNTPRASVGLDSVIKATKKLLAINRGDTDSDERDSLRFKKILGPDDLIAERVRLDAGKLRNALMFKLSKNRSLKFFPSGAFDSYATGHIIGNPLSLPSEEINPVYNLDQQSRVTVFGPGGVSSADLVSEEAQNVHPSQFGVIDAVVGPECLVFNPRYEILTETGFKSIKDITLKDKIGYWKHDDRIIGFTEPDKIILQEYEGNIVGIDNGVIFQETTPDHRVLITNPDLAKDLQYDIVEAKDLIENPLKDIYLFSVQQDLCKQSLKIVPDNCYVKYFHGQIWCLKISGGMFVIRYGSEGIPYWTGNSEKIGVDVRLASMTRIGKNGKLYTLLRDRKTGKKVWMTPDEIEDNIVSFPV